MGQMDQQQPVTEYEVPRQEDLRTILRNHQRWLDGGQQRPHAAKATLKNYDLRDCDLDGFRLERVDFENVCLRGRKFEHANLSGCHFVNVDLSGAEFTAVNLAFAQFTKKTDLSDAIFASSVLNQTVFNDAILDNTEFRIRMDSKPEHACQFNLCKGTGTLFTNAILNNVEFKGNEFQNANFKGAKLTNVAFSSGTYTRCDFSGVRFETPQLIQQQVKFLGSTFERAVFTPESGFKNCVFTDDGDQPCSFKKAMLRGVRLENSTFSKVDFESANLEEAFLSIISVDGSNFTASTGLCGRHKAKLQGVEGAQNARYMPPYDFCTWSRVRTIGSIPLFGVSYFAVIAIILLVSLTETYNLQVNAFKQKFESASTPTHNVAINQREHSDDHESRSDNAVSADVIPSTPAEGKQAPDRGAVNPRWSDKLQEIKLPGTLMHTLGALCLLAIGSTVYRVKCPHEIQENTLVKWVREPWIARRASCNEDWTSRICRKHY